MNDELYDNLTYEEALKKLEAIVQNMENAELPLEELITAFQEGIKLSNLCRTKLTEIEHQVEYLLKNEKHFKEEMPGDDLHQGDMDDRE